MNTKGILAALGLAALVAGCGVDERKDIEKGRCTIGDVEVRAIYHQMSYEDDYMTLSFYKDNKVIGTTFAKGAWLQCDDGRVWNLERLRIIEVEKPQAERQ